MESYVSKVTAAGQLTLPKKVRRSLGIDGAEYVEVTMVGRAAVIRRLRDEDEFLEAIRRKVRKSGLTRARLEKILEESRERTWKRRYVKALR